MSPIPAALPDLNGGFLAKFKYNDQGERTKKQTSAGDAWYVNQYFVLLPNNLPTKHIFVGNERVATKTDAIYMQTPVLDYYHNDHLGSASYLTVQTQDLVQHERYFAFGGLWRPGDEQDETDLPRGTLERNWTFLGKEWDVDESLYYFGPRYFDPHADAWQSTDPFLGKYMVANQDAGVFAPANLGLYTYSWNNPIILRDMDGAAVTDPWYTRALKTAAGVAYGSLQAVTPAGFLADSISVPSHDSDFLTGKAAGEAATGAVEGGLGGALAGGGGVVELGSVGVATPVAVPAIAAGVAVAAHGAANIVEAGRTLQMAAKAADEERAAATGSSPAPAPDPRAGKDFTRAGRRNVIEKNAEAHTGQTTCEKCGTATVPAQHGTCQRK